MKLAVFWRNTYKLRHLSAFFPEFESVVYRRRADVIAGWGTKRTSWLPRLAAKCWRVPYVALEDGFLRSCGLGKHGAPPLSLVYDDIGIYYDARRPSRLEQLIATPADGETLMRAEALRTSLKQKQLTKYNTGYGTFSLPPGEYVLLIDQCEGDASIAGAMADSTSFRAMLQAAKEENPGAVLLIKTHPDVAAGLRKGYLPLDLPGTQLVVRDINPYTLFAQVKKVYTVSSLTGMEALIYGLPVHCFGLPFYAGWGLTTDALSCSRRHTDTGISLPQLIAAAYIRYPRYVNPYSGEACSAEEAVEILAFIRDCYALCCEDYHCYGFARWKRYFITPFLKSPYNRVAYYNSGAEALKAAHEQGGGIAVWAAREEAGLDYGDISVTRVEDGFIRSVGLGSDFTPASSLVVDDLGIHFDHSMPSRLEEILNHKQFGEAILMQAQALRTQLVREQVSKYNLMHVEEKLPPLPKDKPVVLVVGQVEDDASIRCGTVDTHTNAGLLRAVRALRPEAHLLYKPHPEVVAGNRKGTVYEALADQVVTRTAIEPLFGAAEEVHVMTSLAGFEALLQGKKVVVHGLPFYAGWGLTQDVHRLLRRERMLTLDELVAGALICYPGYIDLESGYPAPVEVILQRILRNRAQIPITANKKQSGQWFKRLGNGLFGIIKSLR